MESRNKKKVFPDSKSDDGNPTTATTTTNIPPPAASVLPRPVVIRNPYAIGRSSTAIHKRINTNSNNGNISDINCTATSADHLSAAKAPPPTSKIAAASTTLPSNSDQYKKHHQQHQQDHQQRQQQQQQQQNHRKKFEQKQHEMAYWERIPSRNVSFTSAEVLTITECLKDGQSIARLYCEEGRSVRITGILDHRTARPDNANGEASLVVEMEVRDPMTTTTRAVAERAKAKNSVLSAASSIFQKRPTIPTTPSAFHKRRYSGISSNEERKKIRSKKRPWFVGSNSTQGSKTIKTKSDTLSASTTLKVVVDAKGVVGANQSLVAAVVGSFVTVIGEFAVVGAPDAARTNVTGDSREQAVHYELEARTLRVINNHMEGSASTTATTDMVLYEKALTLRRKSMYERYYYSSRQRSPTALNETAKLLQGCGPPPYDAFRLELDCRRPANEPEGPRANCV